MGSKKYTWHKIAEREEDIKFGVGDIAETEADGKKICIARFGPASGGVGTVSSGSGASVPMGAGVSSVVDAVGTGVGDGGAGASLAMGGGATDPIMTARSKGAAEAHTTGVAADGRQKAGPGSADTVAGGSGSALEGNNTATGGSLAAGAPKISRVMYGFSHLCPHAGAPMSDGYTSGECNVVCPVHKLKFNLKAGGRDVNGDGYKLTTYPVEVRADGVYLGIEEAGGGFFKKWF